MQYIGQGESRGLTDREEMKAADIIEKRKQLRVKIEWPIKVFASHGTLEGEAQNITPQGISICCEEPLHLNEIYLISLMPPDHPPIGVSGKVIWSDFYGICDKDAPVCIGICLVEIPEKDRAFIKELISTSPK